VLLKVAVKKKRAPLLTTLSRFIRLRCPDCGQSSIFRAPFKVKHHCLSCGTLYQREDGFFVGAILANVVTTEFVIMIVYVLCLIALGGSNQSMLYILFSVALLFPLIFYHHSWSAWLSFDHYLETLPKYKEFAPSSPPAKNLPPDKPDHSPD
jgi:uncharacterized protein (DUF983 family)